MSEYDMAILTAALITWFIGRNHPRTFIWLMVIVASFLVSGAYWRLGLPYGAAFAFFCDFVVAVSIYLAYRETWERALMAVFVVSSAINLIYLAGVFSDHEFYSIALEGMSYLAFIVIGGRPLFQKGNNDVRRYNPDSGLRRYVADLSLSLWQTRQDKEKRG